MPARGDEEAYKNKLKEKGDDRSNPKNQVKLCPFYGFKICDNACNFYICRGRLNVVEERIKKGYASKYFTSTLF